MSVSHTAPLSPGKVYATSMEDWHCSVSRLLGAANFSSLVQDSNRLLIKPNLVEALEPPITTPVELVESIIFWLKENTPHLEILIGEGTGSISYDTDHCFRTLGYTEMAAANGVDLIDLNLLEQKCHQNPDCRRWPKLYLPELLDTVFLLSVPVLKAHSLAGVTLTMKNMMGCAPPAHYQEGGHWGKSAFHSGMQEAVYDLNRYRSPDFTLLDATIGMSHAHLWGPHCDPPPGIIAASDDPVALDRYGCDLLGKNWQKIGHIAMAHGVLGQADPIDCVTV